MKMYRKTAKKSALGTSGRTFVEQNIWKKSIALEWTRGSPVEKRTPEPFHGLWRKKAEWLKRTTAKPQKRNVVESGGERGARRKTILVDGELFFKRDNGCSKGLSILGSCNPSCKPGV